MRVKELMTTGICCARPEASLMQISKQMKQENVGAIPVCNDRGEVLGIVTDRDIVVRYVADGNNNITAKDIMSTNMVFAAPDMNTHDAALLFAKYQVRRLPVVSNNKLVGMFSLADIARKSLYIDEAGDALSAISKQNSLS
jgi:CBS domain-containing protein